MFGALDTSLPWVLPIAWGLLIAATFAAAATVADARTRRAMVLIAGLVLMAVIAVSVVYSRTGFDMQGRYVFPLLVILPLTAGEALRRGGERVPAQWATALLIAAAGVATVTHAVAWWVTARRYAIGDQGPLWFFSQAEWVPPAGWPVWAAAVVAGACCCVAAGTIAAAAIRRDALTAPP